VSLLTGSHSLNKKNHSLTKTTATQNIAYVPGHILEANKLRYGSFNPLALELDIYSLAHHLCKILIFYEPRSVTLGNARHFVEE
jgi:hypothetical protein